MNFLKKRAEHLAEYLRDAMGKGIIREPLPPIREWSKQLNVSSHTLHDALTILKNGGMIGSTPREKFYITRKFYKLKRLQHHQAIVRFIGYSKHNQITSLAEILVAISQKLATHDIKFSFERYNEQKIKSLYKERNYSSELLLLASIPFNYQKRFSSHKNVILIGMPAEGINIPYISIDIKSAIRDAVLMLLLHNFKRLNLLIRSGSQQHLIKNFFNQICYNATSTFKNIRWRVVIIPPGLYNENNTIRQLAKTVEKGDAVLTVAPIPPGLVVMALAARGIIVPTEVNVIGINSFPSHIQTLPLLTHYLYPVERFAREISLIAFHYFQSGVLPLVHKEIPLRQVNPLLKGY